jgi:membrane-associated protease RseP (regulator of RpoE activity)
LETLEWLLQNLPGFLAVLAAFGFIIFIHELGHFLIARAVGIRCPSFAIGFGPRLFAFRWRGTEFSVRLLPFGGYVQMVGEEPTSSDSSWHNTLGRFLGRVDFPATRKRLQDELTSFEGQSLDPLERSQLQEVAEHVRYLKDRVYSSLEEVEGNFNYKTIPQRMAVVAGGVTMNFLSALLLFWLVGVVYGLGSVASENLNIVARTEPGTPAAAAGLRPGDRIVAVGGQPVADGLEMIQAIEAYPGIPTTLTVQSRQGTRIVQLTPRALIAGMYLNPPQTKGLPEVVGVLEQSPAARAGLRPGDILTAVEGQPVSTAAEAVAAFRRLSEAPDGHRPLKIRVTVKGSSQPREIALDSASEARPEGKIGIMPSLVMNIGLAREGTTTVLDVKPGSPASRAGILAGDRIYSVAERQVTGKESLDRVLARLAQRRSQQPDGAPLVIGLLREGRYEEVRVEGTPASSAELGVTLEPVTFALVVRESFVWLGRIVAAPVMLVVRYVQNVLSWDLIRSGSAGPVGIMQMIFELSDKGLGEFLFVVAIINFAVGGFNLIPFPALDGSRLVILAISGIRRKEFDPEKEAMLHYAGLIFLLAVVLLVTWADLGRLLSGIPLTR